MSGELLQAIGRTIDAGGLPAPVSIVVLSDEVVLRVPAGGVDAWARYFDRHPVRVTGRTARGYEANSQVIAHLVGARLLIHE
jgi:hypothetical protein